MTYEDAQVPPADSSPFSREEWDRLDAENVALRKERDALRELMNCYNLSGWTDAEQLQKERDEARSERDALRLDAERYRWLREQHEGRTELQYDADGLPMPMEPTAAAWTVFYPDSTLSLEPVGCIPGELDAAIDAAMKERA